MMESAIKTIKLAGEMFIIPNSLTKVRDFVFTSYQEELKELCKLNNISDADNQYMLQIWVVIPEMTDNLGDHGILINDEGYRCRCGNIPFDLVKDLKEGDTVTVKFDGWQNTDTADTVPVVFELELTAKQLEYRYRSFGAWEEVCRALESCAA